MGLGSNIRDRVFIVNTYLFVLVGVAILIRSAAIGLTLLAVIVGGGFLVFGVCRLVWMRKWKQARNGS
ncbi:MAG: hypothetical protein HY314_17755 [Acidobacteria bacterium]|nr:hypothetical protein [Acidobacteriota bacterium]